jgi:murein DD-endopeptidase MepM/ murein hydrolase activator NlpD
LNSCKYKQYSQQTIPREKGGSAMKKSLGILFLVLVLSAFATIVQAGELTSTGFYWPLKDDSPSFSSCGRWLERPSPNGCYPTSNVYHIGSDMGASQNSSVYAIADGVVKDISTSGWTSGSTSNVALIVEHKISDGRSFRAVYGHLLENSVVAIGQSVIAGNAIGKIGDWSGGDHIHFGILSPGLTSPAGSGAYGRAQLSDYGVKSGGYYDNGFVDPIWFITHNVPNNWISRTWISPNNPLTINNPWFSEMCVNSYDSSCDGSDVTTYEECVLEGSTLCAPTISTYSAVNGGNFHSNGGAGGDTGSLPDFIIKNIWLSDSAGSPKAIFRPGEAMQIHIEVKNTGADTPSGIDVDYFRSNGYYKDSSPTYLATDFIHKDDLEGGETHNELKNTTAPTTAGRYNMTAKADPDNDVIEEHDGNNWSEEAVFVVDDFSWLQPIMSLILN